MPWISASGGGNKTWQLLNLSQSINIKNYIYRKQQIHVPQGRNITACGDTISLNISAQNLWNDSRMVDICRGLQVASAALITPMGFHDKSSVHTTYSGQTIDVGWVQTRIMSHPYNCLSIKTCPLGSLLGDLLLHLFLPHKHARESCIGNKYTVNPSLYSMKKVDRFYWAWSC